MLEFPGANVGRLFALGLIASMPRRVDDGRDLVSVQQEHPGSLNVALPYLHALTQESIHPADWLRELCRCIGAGIPAEAAAGRIPLDWSDPA